MALLMSSVAFSEKAEEAKLSKKYSYFTLTIKIKNYLIIGKLIFHRFYFYSEVLHLLQIPIGIDQN